jgi:hypothetical protein
VITGLDLLPQIVEKLDPAFADSVCTLTETLLMEGIVVRPYSGLRGPLEQAILWCQSRTPLEAELIARRFDDERAPFLAAVIRRAMVLSRPGRWSTNNLPGQSWHNFGLAIDAHVVSEDGRAVWGPKHAAYARYADVARDLGLYPGFDLARQDVVHVQHAGVTVRSVIGPWSVVDKMLSERFPNDAGVTTAPPAALKIV